MNTTQTAAVAKYLGNNAFTFMAVAPDGYHWVSMGRLNYYFLFDADNKVVDVQLD